MQDAVQRFETEMTAVLVEQWRGCSWQVAELGAWSLVFAVFCIQVDVTPFDGRLAARRGCAAREFPGACTDTRGPGARARVLK
jgi:hypothetical protein